MSGFFTPFFSMIAPPGAKLIFFPLGWLEKINSRKTFEVIAQLQPDALVAGSHIIKRLTNGSKEDSDNLDLTSLMIAFPIGSAVPHDSDQKLKEHFPNLFVTFNYYGLTESGHFLTRSITPNNMGVIFKGCEIKIVNPETLKVCNAGETGEIWGKSKWAMKGYLNRPEENAKFFSEDGWFRTGDLAHYDEDLILHFDGRLKELIKYQNKHVYPTEV